MTCMKAQGWITPFIQNKLSIEELEEFLDHIDSCPNCKEELEVYYALLTAMKQLDEDKNLSSNFLQELNEKLEKSQERIIHAKYTYYRKITVLILTMIFLAFFISFGYANKSAEDLGIQEEKEIAPPKESEFRLRYEYRIPMSHILEQEWKYYLEDYKKEKEAITE